MSDQVVRIVQIINNKLQLDEQGLKKIRSLKGQIFPICMVGPVLTGKSTLLNQIMGRDIFKVGVTTIPNTKGVYGYIKQLKFSNSQPVYQLVLDVQGFDNSFNQFGEQVDQLLLLLQICTCQIIMYNSFGALDSKTLERLASLSTNVPQNLQHNPKIFFIQRDFHLKLQNRQNQLINSCQYLQYFFNNFKDKKTINKLNLMFKNENFKQVQESSLKCVILPNPGQTKYQKSVSFLTQQIQNTIMQSVYHISNSIKLFSISQYLYILKKAIQILNMGSKLDNLYEQSRKQKQQDSKSCFAIFKTHLTQKIKKQIKLNLPMPEQLIRFKLKNFISEIKQVVKCQHKNTSLIIQQQAGQTKLQQIQFKFCNKLLQENKAKIKLFVQQKVKQMLQSESKFLYQSKNLSQQSIFQIQQQILANLNEYYLFLTSQHQNLIRHQIQKYFNKILIEKLKLFQTQNISCYQESQKQIKNLSYQIQTLEKQKTEKQLIIIQLQSKVFQLQRRIERKVQQKQSIEEQNNKLKSQLQIQMNRHHQIIETYSNNSQNILKQIQNKLKYNLTFEKHQKQNFNERGKRYQQQNKGEQSQKPQINNRQILQQISKVLQILQNSNKKYMQQQQVKNQKILSLQKMNKSLRQRLQQLVTQQNSQKIIQRKLMEAENRLLQNQKQKFQVFNDKQKLIQNLRNQLRFSKQSILNLQSQLSLIRQKAIDKSKTSQFMQKMLQHKQNLLEQIRYQLLTGISKHKQQVNNIKAEYKQKQIQLSSTLSMFILQNEQLVAKNNQLKDKINSDECKIRASYQQKILQRQNQIARLSSAIFESENSYGTATQQFMRVSNKMDKIIKDQQQQISILNIEVQKLKSQIKLIQNELQSWKQKSLEQKEKIHKIQIQKQLLQNKVKRQEILSHNKVKHLQQSNQKLKFELKQKQSTFDMMLLQLRSNNILSNNSNSTNKMIEESNKKSYIKRIDHLQQLTKKELEQISCNNPRPSITRKNNVYIKSESKKTNIEDLEQQNQNRKHHQYGTDKKSSRLSTLEHLYEIKNSNLPILNKMINLSNNSGTIKRL